ncbi:hypothetical protein [Clostridium fallax]|uniref:Uncharacterized protein n=1 Tax=Clostridium fallax TaxID=1533 RepID=A0A1M4UBB9_9CLOT|nr:hypothetical protein [Clostridium fallax]SHE53936.1 hypothetical protein SAMN05443638_104126 [Clostridium fallax]SQB06168.1 Uncharacterised protein [Clostridium fallax]
MKFSPNSFEELRKIGTPIEELAKINQIGFEYLYSYENIISPFKSLLSKEGFDSIESRGDILTSTENFTKSEESDI